MSDMLPSEKCHQFSARSNKTIFLDSTIQQDIVSLRFITPDVAVVEVLTAVAGAKLPRSRGDNFDAKGRLRTRLLQVFVRRSGVWEIVAYHNVEVRDALHLPEPKSPAFK